MKLRTSSHRSLVYVLACLTAGLSSVVATTFTWDGGGANGNTSTGLNWSADAAPAATGDNLIFAGSNNTTVNNDHITSLSSTSITFASGAASFNLGGNAITVGNGASNDNFVTKISTADQTISANITLAGGGRDRTIVMTGGGTLTLSGNINFANDWLFPNTTAGTIVLSGNNSGDGKGGVLTAGTNTMRAMMRNNVAGTSLVLGSDTALGNSGSGTISAGTANLRGLVANQNLTLTTAGGTRNLAGSSLIINTANVTCNSAANLTLGTVINQAGNRDLWVTGAGGLTLQGGIALSGDQTGRTLYLNVTGGPVTVNGALYDTFNNNGLTSGTSNMRKAGGGTMTLNGDSGSYNGLVSVEGGTAKLGHSNALGNATGGTTVSSGATLDLNGQTIGETLSITGAGVGGAGALVNSNTSAAAAVSVDIPGSTSFTVGGAGSIDLRRVGSGNAGIFTVTKAGSGTLTFSGSNHNNLMALAVNSGKVVLANTAGLAADRGVTLNGGTLQLSGANSNLVNDGQAFTIEGGTFDLNGKAEAVASIGGSGGNVTNSNTSAATLYVGGGIAGTSSATYGGAIQDGAGVLGLTKEGSGTQTLAGINTYTGTTTVSAGTLLVTGKLGNTDANVTSSGTMTLQVGSSYQMLVGGLGLNTRITGTGSLALDGTLDFDLASAAIADGNVWNVVDTAALNETYGGNFSVAGFFNNAGTWTRTDGSNTWTYTQSTGNLALAVVPESPVALLGLVGVLGLLRRRR